MVSPASEEEFWRWVGNMARAVHRRASLESPWVGALLEPEDLVSEAAVEVLALPESALTGVRLRVARWAMWGAIRFWRFGVRRGRDAANLSEPEMLSIDDPDEGLVLASGPADEPLEICERNEAGALFWRAARTGVLSASQTVVLRGHLWEGIPLRRFEGDGWGLFRRGIERLRDELGIRVAPERPGNEDQRRRVLAAMKGGRNAAEAGRLCGVPIKTAQRWAREQASSATHH